MSWNFERMFTPHHVSHVTCQVPCSTCHMSYARVRYHISNYYYETVKELESWNLGRMFTLSRVSHITYHVTHITCHMACVTCHFIFFFSGQSGGASWWRVCYQRGLPRLVLPLDWNVTVWWSSHIAASPNQMNECLNSFC